jgi:hypothetical protein
MAKLTGAKKKAFLARMAKGRRKKSVPKRTKSATVKRKSVSRSSNTMKRRTSKRRSPSRRNKVTGFLQNPTLKKVFIGAGTGAVVGTVVGQIAPQYAQLAGTASAFITGGPIGGAVSLFLNGGLSQLTGLLSGGGSTTQTGGL